MSFASQIIRGRAVILPLERTHECYKETDPEQSGSPADVALDERVIVKILEAFQFSGSHGHIKAITHCYYAQLKTDNTSLRATIGMCISTAAKSEGESYKTGVIYFIESTPTSSLTFTPIRQTSADDVRNATPGSDIHVTFFLGARGYSVTPQSGTITGKEFRSYAFMAPIVG